MNRKRPQPEYLITDIKLVPGKMIIAIADIFPTEVNNLDGIENVDDCMIKELREANCSFICLPILFNFLNDRIPFCATGEDYLCMLKHIDTLRRRGPAVSLSCYSKKQKRSTVVQGTIVVYDYIETNLLQLGIYISDMTYGQVTTKKEKYIMTTEDFIGSVGGSLGLFLGFSFFCYASDALDKLFNRLCH